MELQRFKADLASYADVLWLVTSRTHVTHSGHVSGAFTPSKMATIPVERPIIRSILLNDNVTNVKHRTSPTKMFIGKVILFFDKILRNLFFPPAICFSGYLMKC